jgi:hypothetical protein
MATSFSGGGSRSTRREPPTLGSNRKKISKYHFKNKIIDILNILRTTQLWNNAQIPNSYKPITNTAWVRAQLGKLQKGYTRLAAASDKVYQLLPRVGGSLRVLRLPPPLKLVAMIAVLVIGLYEFGI